VIQGHGPGPANAPKLSRKSLLSYAAAYGKDTGHRVYRQCAIDMRVFRSSGSGCYMPHRIAVRVAAQAINPDTYDLGNPSPVITTNAIQRAYGVGGRWGEGC
jgi:hypothetical protein